jgi:protein-S-isoprenylcysteine O-methyltransferase Ste14
MLRWLRRLNDLPVFDPARWPAREVLARTVGILAVGTFVVRRVLQLPAFPGFTSAVEWARPWFKPFESLPGILSARPFDLEAHYGQFGYSWPEIRALWVTRLLIWIVETGILLGYILAFLTRRQARSVARGFMETLFPLVLGILPFVIVVTGYTYHEWFPERSRCHLAGLFAINGILIAAGAANVIGLLSLRPAFTIMTEARVFVRTGLYRLVRHPLYAAHFVIYLCYTLLHLHVGTAALYVMFVAGQSVRAHNEEKKMAAVFPEYEEYRESTGMFFPRMWEFRPRVRKDPSRSRPPAGEGGDSSTRDS